MQQDAGGSAAFTEKLTYLILNEANEATYTTFTTLVVYVMLKFDMKDRCCNLLTELQTTMQTSGHWAWVSVIRSLLALNDTILWSHLDSRQVFAHHSAAKTPVDAKHRCWTIMRSWTMLRMMCSVKHLVCELRTM